MTKSTPILIVEDDDWTAEQYIRILGSAGFSATFVTNAPDAMASIDAHPPSLIILDLLLTGQNALPLLHELRSHADLAGIPIVLCTNSADALADEDVTAYGIRQVIDKTTMQPNDLIAAAKKVLS